MTRSYSVWYHPLQFLLIGGVIFTASHTAIAQRIPVADESLGNERSVVSPDEVIRNVRSNRIDGGARRGSNLFHSFRDFNVNEGRGVYFTNPDGVTNILTRVTGNSQSDILGRLGVLGNANLFLLNPNGILFGRDARLDLGGSFLASTSNSFLFDNGFAFSATDPQAPPLLTVSAPIGLQYGANPGTIQTQGARLEVPNGQTLTLAGGAVNINGGALSALGGRVELAGVAEAGQVGLVQRGQEWRLNVPEGLERADVAIRNDAIVNVRASGGGDITITSRNLRIVGTGTTQNSPIDTETKLGLQAGIEEGLGSVDAQAGDIEISTTEVLNLDAMGISNGVLEGGTGNAGNIRITTGSLYLTNGALVGSNMFGRGNAGNITITTGIFSLINGTQIGASIYGQGNAGNITVTARDTVTFDGTTGSNGFISGVLSGVAPRAIGQGGNITITTSTLSLSNGGFVDVSTFGKGKAGNITITARDTVSFDGVNSSFGTSTGAFSQVAPGVIGQGGSIRIITGTLALTNGAQLVTATFGRGDAGNIIVTAREIVSFDGVNSNGSTSGIFSSVQPRAVGQGGNVHITTGSLSFTGGGGVSVGTFGRGDAGNITVTARDTVTFDGVGSNGDSSGVYSAVEPEAVGQGGRIRVNTEQFSIINGAGLGASSEGRGRAGRLIVNARQLQLDQGSILTETAAGQGGNITLQVPELLLRNQSRISTTAGTEQAGGDGGNITIDSDFIAAVENEDSNISANAFTGRGGNVEITTQGLFGIQSRSQPTAQSDITASSEQGVSGEVTINTPNVDPTQGLIQLPVDVTDASQLIAEACPTGNDQNQLSQFIVTGRGGLPPIPSEAMQQDAVQVDLVTVDSSTVEEAARRSDVQPMPQQRDTSLAFDAPLVDQPLVEAQGWKVAADGTVTLIAAAQQNRDALSHRLARCGRS